MKIVVALSICIGLLASCSPSNSCIENRIADFKKEKADRGHVYIYHFTKEGKDFYIFDHGIAFDATAEVVDSDCNEVCVYGGYRVTPDTSCTAYQSGINNAEQIWPE